MLNFSLDQAAFRRSLLFLLAIGGPLCVGVWPQSPAGALVGAVTGLLLSFADEEGPVAGRPAILAMAAGALAIGGLIGVALQGFPWPVCVLFVPLTFAWKTSCPAPAWG